MRKTGNFYGRKILLRCFRIDSTGQILLDSTKDGMGPIKALASRYAESIGKALFKPVAGKEEYVVKNDPYGLIFRHDDQYGNMVILEKIEDFSSVQELLKKL